MNEINDSLIEFEQQEILSDQEIFTSIWSSPRKVFEYIYQNNYDKYLVVLLIFSGITKTFDRASQKNMGDIWNFLPLLEFQ